MTLEQLMAFSVSRTTRGRNRSGSFSRIAGRRRRHIRRTDRGRGACLRPARAVRRARCLCGRRRCSDARPFEDDDGGWLQDVPLLDQLVIEKLGVEGEKVGAEGWKWVAVAMDFAYGETDGLREIERTEAEISARRTGPHRCAEGPGRRDRGPI